MRTPFDEVSELYEVYPQARTFEEDLCAHISSGYVISTPEFFVMGRGVDRWGGEETIADPWHRFPEGEVNAWFVYAFAGRLTGEAGAAFRRAIPYELEWVGWARYGRRVRFYRWEEFVRGWERVAWERLKAVPPRRLSQSRIEG